MKSRTLHVLVAAFLAVTLARAESGYLRMRSQVLQDAGVYSKEVEDPNLAGDGWLQQTDGSMEATVEVSMKMTGVPAQTTKQRIQNPPIPGKTDKRGYSRARLRHIAGRIELLIDALEVKDEPVKDASGKETGEKKEIRAPKQENIALEFVSKGASWKDYEEGRTVELRFTKAAVDSILERAKVEAANSSSAKAADGRASLSISVKQAKVPGSKPSDFGKVTASKKRIEVIHLPTETTIVMKVSS